VNTDAYRRSEAMSAAVLREGALDGDRAAQRSIRTIEAHKKAITGRYHFLAMMRDEE
jgi:hypothetical protein